MAVTSSQRIDRDVHAQAVTIGGSHQWELWDTLVRAVGKRGDREDPLAVTE